MKRTEIDYNKTYYNKQGKAFKVIKEAEPRLDKNGQFRRRIRVMFESGYETEVPLSILNQNPISLTDYLSPTVYGIGMIGYANPRKNWKDYQRWTNMLARCYDLNNKNYNSYGGKGVYVCLRWLRFDYYLEDIVKLPGYEDMINNPNVKYHIDKDVLQQGCEIKVYSPKTCIWLPETLNNMQKNIDNKIKYNSKYFGVVQTKNGNYAARIHIKNENIGIGTYSNEIAAANAYNYYSWCLGRPMLNDVPYMTHEQFSSYLTKPIKMIVDENKFYGVDWLPYGNYRVVVYSHGKKVHIGVYTSIIAAANVYNHFAFATGNPKRNKVPFMSPQECRQYMVRPRVMCNIIPTLIQPYTTLKQMCTIVN
jgi:hypothetical protein